MASLKDTRIDDMLDQAAAKTKRTKSSLIREALELFLPTLPIPNGVTSLKREKRRCRKSLEGNDL